MRQFDFVLCKHPNDNRNFLFRAPAYSGLNKGDTVMVDTKYGEQLAKVVSCVTVDTLDQPKIDFIINAMDVEGKEIKRVLSRVLYSRFDYSEEKKEE